jgi:hypothetical protein
LHRVIAAAPFARAPERRVELVRARNDLGELDLERDPGPLTFELAGHRAIASGESDVVQWVWMAPDSLR